MRLRSISILMAILLVSIASNSVMLHVQSAPGSDKEDPKDAVLGSNSGNISSNTAGGRFFFDFPTEENTFYSFELTGDENTEFDIYLFDSSYLPSLIVEDSIEFEDSYPVVLSDFTTDNEWVLIQIYSSPTENGGTGDFTLTISESDETVDDDSPVNFNSFLFISSLIVFSILVRKLKFNKFQ